MWYGIATLVGTIIGVGIFGLPYAASRAGFFVQLAYLGVFACVFTLLHLMYGEIMLRTHERYRLPGYVGLYFGRTAKRIIQSVTIISLMGGMMAYILVGGSFLRMLTHGAFGSVGAYQVLFWAAMSVIVALGLSMVKRTEIVMLLCMVAIIMLIFFMSIPYFNMGNFLHSDLSNFFFPYGITLFAFSGAVAIPAVRDILQGREATMKKTIIAGTLIPAVLYALFVFAVIGVTGLYTSEDALSGLNGVLGMPMKLLGALFGILAIATSYIVFGLYLRDMLWYDFTVPRKGAVAIAVMAPIALVLAYPGSYITIMSFLGAVGGGVEAIFIVAAFIRAKKMGERKPEYALAVPTPVLYALITLFALGIGYILLFGGRI